jgi:hypothetical protein
METVDCILVIANGLVWRRKGVGGRMWWKYIVMHENGTMRPVETILRMGGEEIKENDGGVSLIRYIISAFVNVSLYPHYNSNIIKKQTKSK